MEMTMLRNTKRKFLATILCMTLISMMLIYPTLSAEPLVTVTAGSGSGQAGISDWSSAWGVAAGTGLEMQFQFSAPFTDAAANSYFTDSLAQYFTVNGVSLTARRAADPSLGIAAIPAGLWGGNNTVLINKAGDTLNLIMIGGGTGNLNIATENTIVISSNFPLLDGSTLGRDVTLTFNPATLLWTAADAPTTAPVATDITVVAGSGSGQQGISDWGPNWTVGAGNGMEMILTFSDDFTTAAANTRLENELASHITVNGINLATRIANDPSLGVSTSIPGWLWGGSNTIISNLSNTILDLRIIGGGTGNLDITKTNTVVLDANFPFADGTTLGRIATLTFNPSTLSWTTEYAAVSEPTTAPTTVPTTEPTAVPTTAPTAVPTAVPTTVPGNWDVAVTAGSGSNQAGISNWSSSWGVPAGTGMEMEVVFSKAYTNQPANTYFTDSLSQYITVNGVNLATRRANDPSLGIAAIPAGLWGGNNTTLVGYSGFSLHIILVGGGTGNLDITKTNTVVLDADFPMQDGSTLGRNVTLTFDPATLSWSTPDNPEGTPTSAPTAVPTATPTTTPAAGEVYVSAGAGASSGQLGICDWSSAWGVDPGNGMEMELLFSKAFNHDEIYTQYITTLAQYITINGVNLATRYANDPALGIADVREDLWGGFNTALQNYSDTSLHIIMVGGGTGNLDINFANTLVIDADFPFADGTTLGRQVTFTFNPETLEWTTPDNPEVTPTAIPTYVPGDGSVTVEAGAGETSGQLGICDWSSAWGVDPGNGMEMELLFSAPFTDAPENTYFTEAMAQYITVNGVNLADRFDRDPSLGIAATPATLWGGNSVVLLNKSPNSLHIVMVGGGTGNLDIMATNTVVIDSGFPLLDGTTLGRDVTLVFDPEILEWTDTSAGSSDSSSSESHSISRDESPLLTVSAGTPDGAGQNGIWDRSTEWGLDAGKGFEVQLTFSGEYTNAGPGSNLNSDLASFITINGVNLASRANFDTTLGMDNIRLDLFDGNNIYLTNSYSDSKKLAIIMLGGGAGNFDRTKENTIVLSADFPLPGGLTLDREITLTYHPNTQIWTSSLDEPGANPETGENTMVIYLFITLAMIAGAAALFFKQKKIRE